MRKKIVVLTGAGVSAESGIKTFRDADGLWEGHDVTRVATPEGWQANPGLVLDFYNQRRRQLKEVLPNPAHHAIADLEAGFEVVVITQNVDDLHERAGSSRVIHLHGELKKVRSSGNEQLVFPWEDDLNLGDRCPEGHQLRPHIVWFGEPVPAMERAILELTDAHHVLIVGSSMQVYPAAGLVHFAPMDAQIYYVDPRPSINYELDLRDQLTVIAESAGVGVPMAIERIRQS